MGRTQVRDLAGEAGRAPGTYVLVLRLPEPQHIAVGRLGAFAFPAGYYAYVGSACGPGGLAGRLRHHLSAGARVPWSREEWRHDVALRRPHWHVDYLRRAAAVEAVWLGAAHREHDWAALLREQPGSSVPVARFGASDCACPAHLVHFAGPPDLEAFRRALRENFPADPPVRLWLLGSDCERRPR